MDISMSPCGAWAVSSSCEVSGRQHGKSRVAFEYAKLMVEYADLPRMKYYLSTTQYEHFLSELGQDFVDKHCVVMGGSIPYE